MLIIHLGGDDAAWRGNEAIGDDHLLNLLVQDVLHHLKKTLELEIKCLFKNLAKSSELLLICLGLFPLLFILWQLETLLEWDWFKFILKRIRVFDSF